MQSKIISPVSKILFYFLIVFATGWVLGMAAGFAVTKIGQSMKWNPAVTGSLSILFVTLVRFSIWIPAFRFFLKKSLYDTCFRNSLNHIKLILGGIVITFLSITVIFIIGLVSDWIEFQGWMFGRMGFSVTFSTLLVSLLINVSVALTEETIFRGYLINSFRTILSIKTSLIVSSILFSLAHLLPYASKYSLIDMSMLIVLFIFFGFVFGWAYLRTGSLWLPVAIHFAWDFFENDVINLSGDILNPHLVGAITQLKGPLNGPSIENAILLDALALILIFSGTFIWLKPGKLKA